MSSRAYLGFALAAQDINGVARHINDNLYQQLTWFTNGVVAFAAWLGLYLGWWILHSEDDAAPPPGTASDTVPGNPEPPQGDTA